MYQGSHASATFAFNAVLGYPTPERLAEEKAAELVEQEAKQLAIDRGNRMRGK